MIQTNLDSILIEFNDSVVGEMSEKDFGLYMTKMILEAKDVIREQMQAMKKIPINWKSKCRKQKIISTKR